MQQLDLKDLLPQVVKLARAAGGEIMKIYDSEFDVEHKQDDSPLTAADLASHDCIIEGLKKIQPELPVISEESADLPFEVRSAWHTYWLVDPLDGTKEFIKRNGEFTVNIALISEHKPILGVVYVPARDQTYSAAEGHGAFRQDGDDAPQEIRVRDQAPDRISVVGSRSHPSPELADYLDRLGDYDLVSIGSSLKFCLVAEGQADLYPRLGLTSEWDTAAAQCVVEQAGGRVIEVSGQPLRYNAKESILNPYFLVLGDTSRDWTAHLS